MTEQEKDKKNLPTPASKATQPDTAKVGEKQDKMAHPAAPATDAGENNDGGSRLSLVLALLAIVLTVGIAVTAYFTWREVTRLATDQQQGTQQTVARSEGLEKRLQDTARRLDGIQGEVDRSLTDAQREQREEMKQLRAEQQAVEDSMGLVRAQMGRSQDGWLLAEVEYLLRIANQRLQLQRDVPTALAALMAADERLQGLADPGYLPVRHSVAQEIDALRTTPRLDLGGVALQLSSLSSRVADMPLKGARYVPASERLGKRPESATASDWREVPTLIWSQVKDLVAFREVGTPATPMLPPEQHYFLQQNLRLVLESARLALLQSDPDNYKISLETAQNWVLENFDQDDPATLSMKDGLIELLEKDIRPELPDISASLRLLRQQLNLKQKIPDTGQATPARPAKPRTSKTSELPKVDTPPQVINQSPATPAATSIDETPQSRDATPVADNTVLEKAATTKPALGNGKKEDAQQAIPLDNSPSAEPFSVPVSEGEPL